ncbi:DHHC family palmitoyl transferase with a signal peptide and 4 transmembrane domain [Cryptosporidium bovis]|uniref:DHHC family palmitoyl transferase with a signal peptide and 4 transmembrane domain n=1 Tax=Cryptosporidium bovis TaxID=310047 RepID=UPI00351A9E32|nr:DHHC family palmitoyl transferase with a signal peptide and 4 transmembrane domain [Cryptosporidium bovis]
MKNSLRKYLVNWIPVLLTLSVIIFSISLTSIQIIGAHLNKKPRFQNINGVILFSIYHIFNLLLIISFLSLSIFDPGSLEALQCLLEAPSGLKSKRYCDKCAIRRWKPQRAHHCSICNKCIFKMDHHCFLINNCVGFSNQKNYILFLFYLMCSTLVSTFSTVFLLIKYQFHDIRETTHFSLTNMYINLITNIVILFCSITFFIDQIDYILTNSSLIELIINKRGRETILSKKLHSIFGENIYFWLVPFGNNSKPEFTEELYEVINYPVISSFETIDSNNPDLYDYFSRLSNSDTTAIKKRD